MPGKRLVEFQHRLEKQWNSFRFGEVKVKTSDGQHVFEIQVFLGDLDPQLVRVELYAGGVKDGVSVRQEMKLSPKQSRVSGSHGYSTSVSADRPPQDYTARLVPHFDGVAIPLEDARVLWQR